MQGKTFICFFIFWKESTSLKRVIIICMVWSLQVWSILYVWSLILVLYEVTVEEHFRDENSQIFLGHMSSPSMVEKKKYSIREGIHIGLWYITHVIIFPSMVLNFHETHWLHTLTGFYNCSKAFQLGGGFEESILITANKLCVRA